MIFCNLQLDVLEQRFYNQLNLGMTFYVYNEIYIGNGVSRLWVQGNDFNTKTIDSCTNI